MLYSVSACSVMNPQLFTRGYHWFIDNLLCHIPASLRGTTSSLLALPWPQAQELPLEQSWKMWPGDSSTSPCTQQTSENCTLKRQLVYEPRTVTYFGDILVYLCTQWMQCFLLSPRYNSINNVKITLWGKSLKFGTKRHQSRVRILPNFFL